HEVLPLGQVDTSLAADRRIDLGHERRGDVDASDAAEVDRGEETGGIAERTSTDGDDPVATLDAEPCQLARCRLDDVESLGCLALGEHHPLGLVAEAPQI